MQFFVRALCLCLAMLAGAAGATDRGAAPPAPPAAAPAPVSAPIPILVYSAYTCPYCAQSTTILTGLQKKYPGRLRLIYKHFPLGRDAQALLPHLAAVAAAEQGKLDLMHATLFEAVARGLDRNGLRMLARGLKLDEKRFLTALDAASTRAAVEDDVMQAQALKVNATPTFYIEGFKLEGLHQAEVFERIIEHKLAAGGPGNAP